ncbi:ribonuclease III [bacterium]|nr:ribonuclease III [bacterium]
MAISFGKLSENINYEFKNIELLRQSLTHRSYTSEQNRNIKDNERLEFLGDAIIGSCVTEELYKIYPDYTEGELSILKSSLVSRNFLSELAVEINLGEFILLGFGEIKAGGHKRKRILANTFEALVGAIFIDSGYRTVYDFIWSLIKPKLTNINQFVLNQNFKNILQAFTQKHYGNLPKYNTIAEEGLHHERKFTVEVQVNDTVVGTGEASSKKKASLKAAEEAIKKLKILV